jgi:hypothetical protein
MASKMVPNPFFIAGAEDLAALVTLRPILLNPFLTAGIAFFVKDLPLRDLLVRVLRAIVLFFML